MFLIFRVQNETEPLALANDTSFGLASVILSEDLRRAQSLARQIEAGMVFINHPPWTAPELPFGGIKRSGYGHELSSLGDQEFVNKKLVRTQDGASPLP